MILFIHANISLAIAIDMIIIYLFTFLINQKSLIVHVPLIQSIRGLQLEDFQELRREEENQSF